MARDYDNIADAISAVNGEVSEQSTKIADILEALEGKGSSGGLVKIGTVATNPTEGSYGQLEIPANDGVFLCTNCSITPNNTNRVPWAVLCYVNTTSPIQGATVMTYQYGGTGITASGSGQSGDIAYFKGISSIRFNTACTYDLYKLY